MSKPADIRRLARRALFPVFCVLLAGYFTYHLIQGDRGLIAYFRLNKEIDQLETRVARSNAARAGMENRVARLRSRSLDPDMLDERAREVLGYAHEDEIIVLEPRR